MKSSWISPEPVARPTSSSYYKKIRSLKDQRGITTHIYGFICGLLWELTEREQVINLNGNSLRRLGFLLLCSSFLIQSLNRVIPKQKNIKQTSWAPSILEKALFVSSKNTSWTADCVSSSLKVWMQFMIRSLESSSICAVTNLDWPTRMIDVIISIDCQQSRASESQNKRTKGKKTNLCP